MNKFLVDTVDSKDKLIQYFRKGIKKDNELRIGVEHEKFLFNKSDLKRVDYNQIKKVFENLKNNGWEPEYEKDRIIGLKRENQKITTEQGPDKTSTFQIIGLDQKEYKIECWYVELVKNPHCSN